MGWVRPDWKEQVIFECEGGDIKARPFFIEDGSILSVIAFKIKTTTDDDIIGNIYCFDPESLIWFSRLLELNATLLKDSDENIIIE